jgi:hypothetical protein
MLNYVSQQLKLDEINIYLNEQTQSIAKEDEHQ